MNWLREYAALSHRSKYRYIGLVIQKQPLSEIAIEI
jgi:hypothetical protein